MLVGQMRGGWAISALNINREEAMAIAERISSDAARGAKSQSERKQ